MGECRPIEVLALDSSAENSTRQTGVADSGDFERFTALAAELAAIGRKFYERGWVFGTSGNFSATISHEPMRLAITSAVPTRR